jgi:hypothetical protein
MRLVLVLVADCAGAVTFFLFSGVLLFNKQINLHNSFGYFLCSIWEN